MAKFHYKDTPSENQKKTFRPYLAEDEELVLVAGLSSAYIRSQFIMYLLIPGLIFGGLGYGLGWILKFSPVVSVILAIALVFLSALVKTSWLYHANRYLLTTRRVIIKKGLFAVKLTAALYDKITHLEVDQSFIDRLFLHHGSIVVNTAGMNKGEIVLRFVDYPLELKNLLERLINREREQFGRQAVPITAVEGEVVD